MATSETKADGSLRKMLPWLKRLKGALDDDDSSDSTSQQSEATPTKAARDGGGRQQSVKKRRHEDSEAAAKRQGKRRVIRRSSKSPKRSGKARPASSSSSSSSEDPDEIRRRRMEKAARRKRLKLEAGDAPKTSHKAAKKVKSPGNSAQNKAAASREQRMQILRALRRETGEGARLTAFRLKRQQSAEDFKARERNRMRAIRARRAAGVDGTDADVEDEGGPRRSSLSVGKHGTAVKSGERKAVSLKKKSEKKKLVVTPSPAASTEPAEPEEEDTAEVAVLPKEEFVDDGKQNGNDDEKEESTVDEKVKSQELAKLEDAKEKHEEDPKVESVEPVKLEVGEKGEKVDSDVASKGQESVEENKKPHAVALSTSVVVVKKEVLENSRVVVSSTTSGSVKLEVDEAVPISDTKSLPDAPEMQCGNEEENSAVKSEPVLSDATPIPRKTVDKDSTTIANASAFVIPKRSFAKTVNQTNAPGLQADRDDIKRSLEPRVPVVLKPLSSPASSPQLSKPDPVRLQRKRMKNPVPLKNMVISKQDRVVMRLAKKRNSIFMATSELAAQLHVGKDSANASISHMGGYEVYDANGKLLPDIIPRLSCATKRELAAKRDTYSSSFFGVSLSAPKSKGKTSAKLDECASDKIKTREINCYEKLDFERPRDREFYQKRMYGTTFVPQSLRGWITVIIRNARFERKSTGIRFNQDRDRDEFAASLVKRYTINKSVPRCDIPRENWQRLLRNQPGTVYLHYYNREDAKQASQVFRDDHGNLLELKMDYKTGVVISPSSSPAADVRQGTPRRSCSSERVAPRSSPFSSQNGSARSTPLRQRDRFHASKSGHRKSRYDRGPSPASAPWPRDGGRYGPSLSGSKRPRRSRSRSRSRSKQFPSERYNSAARNPRTSSASSDSNHHLHKPNDQAGARQPRRDRYSQ